MRLLRFFALLLGLALAGSAAAGRFVVTTPVDLAPGSLRAAIQNANASPGRDTIDFEIDEKIWGPGPWTLSTILPLPVIRDPVLIRGFSQPGSAPGMPSRVMIEIDHGSIPFTDDDFGAALTFVRGAEHSVVLGLSFFGRNSRNSAAVLILADDVRISGSLFGVRADGSVTGLGGVGIGSLMSARTTIGGGSFDEGNVFAGMDSAVVVGGKDHTLRNNWFGSDDWRVQSPGTVIASHGVLTGRIALFVPRNYRSIYPVSMQQAHFGLRDSVISDNHFLGVDGDAIYLYGGGAGATETFGNRIENNVFGQDFWGQATFGAGTAIRLAEGARDTRVTDNLIRGGNAGIIAHPRSSAAGAMPAGQRNRLSRNRFFDLHATPVISLRSGGSVPNDPLDDDEGPNRLQNKPELHFATSDGWLEGQLASTPQRSFTIEIFLSAACHGSGSGSDVADRFLDAFEVTTDAQGNAAFARTLPHPPFGRLQPGDVLTATATDMEGNTSELSGCLELVAPLPVTLTQPRYPARVPAMERQLEVKVDVSGAGAPSGEVRFSLMVDGSRIEHDLGRAPLVNGVASLPTPVQGWLPHQGRYRILAHYEGDRRNAAAAVLSSPIVVFRPPLALAAFDQSAPVRVDMQRWQYEWLDPATANWMPLALTAADDYLGASRFGGEVNDQALAWRAGSYVTVDVRGRTTPRSSGVLGNDEILALIHVDGDVRADAIVRNPVTREHALVLCLFERDGCETVKRLDVGPEWQWLLAGDFDGDGRSDLAFYDHGKSQVVILVSNGDLPGSRVTYLRMPPLAAAQMAAVDVNGDGFDDLAWIDPAASTLDVAVFRNGIVARQAQGDLRIGGWSLPGAVYTARAGTQGYGVSDLLLSNASGDAVLWSDLRLSGSVLTGTLGTLYNDPDVPLLPTR